MTGINEAKLHYADNGVLPTEQRRLTRHDERCNGYTLSNDGFYMAPSGDEVFHVACDNMFEGDISADALGITACLYAYTLRLPAHPRLSLSANN